MSAAVFVSGDARSLPLPDESVDLVVTSPPYYRLRRYTSDAALMIGEIGNEPSPAEYLKALLECTVEMARVLKPTGHMFVNLGDVYCDGQLRLLPERYRIACADELGLRPRAVVVWDKTSRWIDAKARGRVRRTHEEWAHLVRARDAYDGIDAVRERPPEDYRDRPQYRRAVELFTASGFTDEHRAAVRSVGVADTAGGAVRSGGSFTSRNGQLAAEVKARLGSYYRELCGSSDTPRGSVPGSVWQVATRPLKLPAQFRDQHYATFPRRWPERLIAGWCPPGGVVLDPFGGVGTTAIAACLSGRVGISVDLSEGYAAVGRWLLAAAGGAR